jgi:tetratricopeptide (TPR) repeat protein
MRPETPGTDASQIANTAALPFVGRSELLAELDGVIARAHESSGSLVLLAGEPGIGKSRLAQELAKRARQSGMQVLWGNCWEHQGTPAFWPWTQILRAAERELQTTPPPPSDTQRYAAIEQLAPDLAQAGAAISPADHDSALANHFAVLDRFSSWLRRASTRTPLLLVLDDLQWADAASMQLLRFLTADIRDQAVMLLGTYRDVEINAAHPHAPVLGELTAKALPITVPGLTLSEVSELAAHARGALHDRETARALHVRTGGNPLFVRELLRMGETEHDALRPRISESVRHVIERRLERLTEPCRRLLSAASVIGPDFSLSLLSRILLVGQEPESLRSMLDEAVGARLLERGAADEYHFGHALVREACYAIQSDSLTRALHRRVAEAIEERHAHDLDGRHAQLAWHYDRAGAPSDFRRALEHALLAGRQATRLSAHRDAAAHFRSALELSQRLDTAEPGRHCELLLELGAAEMHAGHNEQGRASLQKAVAIASGMGDGELLARAALCFGVPLAVGRIDTDEVDLLGRALCLLDPQDSPLRALLLARLAIALMFGAQDARCVELSDAALAMARRVAQPATLARVLFTRHQTLWNGGFPDERRAIAEEGIALADAQQDARLSLELRALRLGDLVELGDMAKYRLEVSEYADRVASRKQDALGWHVLLHRATLAMLECRFEQSEQLAGQALALGQRFQHPGIELFHASVFLTLRFLQGRSEEVLDRLRAFVDAFPGLGVYRAAFAAFLCEAGRLGDARTQFEYLASSDFQRVPHDFQRVGCLALLIGVCHQLGDAVRAEALYRLMLPHRGFNVRLTRNGASTLGATEYFLGMAALTAGRVDDAVEHLGIAVVANRDGGILAMLANSHQMHGRALLARGAAGDTAHAELEFAQARVLCDTLGLRLLFQAAAAPVPAPVVRDESSLVHEGEYWVLQYAGVNLRLRDSIGMQLLARLLSEPGREFSALELRAGSGELRLPPSDAGPVLDDQAVLAYKRKRHELGGEIEEAEQWGDLGRAERARELLGALEQQLSQAIGLGGKQRRAASQLERARVTVTKAIRAAVRKLDKDHPKLGGHLERSIRTGHVCSYSPDPATAPNWQVHLPSTSRTHA